MLHHLDAIYAEIEGKTEQHATQRLDRSQAPSTAVSNVKFRRNW
jgi:hypothetical protein